MDEVKKLIELTKTAKYHAGLYYTKDSPEISDYEYDMLLKELIRLEEKYPEQRLRTPPL